MSEYRIPKIEEFVQGFEFEVAHDYSFCIFDVSKPKEKTEKEREYTRYWITCKVWWMQPENKLITEKLKDGNILTVTGRFVNFFKPFDEKSYLEQGLIRVKLNK